MSLVGTRPPTVDEWELYEPHHRARMAFRPGLTGMWQVSGRSNITDFEEVVKLDTKYISEWSLKGYTEKQWGRDCKELPSFIIKRLPVRLTFDNNYFNALYQGIPVGGYTRMVANMLEGIEVRLNTDYLEHKEELDAIADKVVYTGPIDAYFGYKLGTLEYRSVRFETETLDIPNFQGNAAVNYTDRETPWTRIIEHKWFEFGKDHFSFTVFDCII